MFYCAVRTDCIQHVQYVLYSIIYGFEALKFVMATYGGDFENDLSTPMQFVRRYRFLIFIAGDVHCYDVHCYNRVKTVGIVQ